MKYLKWILGLAALYIVVKLKGNTKDYFINRGLEQGISIDNWKNNLLGEKVELTLIKHHWSILNPTGRLTSIARLKSGDDYLFDRM